MKIALSIPDGNGTPMQIDSGLPKGVPTGGIETASKAIGVILDFAIIAAIIFSLYLLVRGGINMTTSGGDKERFAKGRERLRYAIIGLIIVFLSFGLINLIGGFFGVNLLRLSK
ncbi:MAG: hypothetical protein HY425_01100 [Candidatus Levybacteria bacterium]|nr:hypothetical protein [Candidatus Levybacteria bacterium]